MPNRRRKVKGKKFKVLKKLRGGELEKNSTEYYRITPEEERVLFPTTFQNTESDEKELTFDFPQNKSISDEDPDNGRSFDISAYDDNGKPMSFDQWAEYYGFSFPEGTKYKLVTHNNKPYYNVTTPSVELDTLIDPQEFKIKVEKALSNISFNKNKKVDGDGTLVLAISDLHLGALVTDTLQGMHTSHDVINNFLQRIIARVNGMGSEKVHVLILGDLIESFSGLNHANVWQNLSHKGYGAHIIKYSVKLLGEFLSSINNLQDISIVAGNHDRTSAAKDIDTEGHAADIIAWGLQLKGFDVNYSPTVLSRKIDGINYILTHGHLGLSRLKTNEFLWQYGLQNCFNVVLEGHIHQSVLKKEKLSQEYLAIIDSGIKSFKKIVPSIFTGNSYSENLGYTTMPGYNLFYNNGEGVPDFIECSLFYN